MNEWQNELEVNCDFSSSNNVWAKFYDFLAVILYFVGLFFLWQIDWNFEYVFLAAILHWNFKLLYSDFGVGRMLHRCVRRWTNIKTTLCWRFVFDGITTVRSMSKCSISRFYCPYQRPNVGSMLGHCLRRWPRMKHHSIYVFQVLNVSQWCHLWQRAPIMIPFMGLHPTCT